MRHASPLHARVAATATLLLVLPALAVVSGPLAAGTFQPGDVFVSLHDGSVQWRGPDGTLKGTLVGAIPGKAEGMGFDASLRLHVTHHCADATCLLGNTVEKFDVTGVPMGTYGSGYNCNPNSIVFDFSGAGYVGEQDCAGDIRQFSAAGVAESSFDTAVESRGSAWIDLAGDGCTMFYTSKGPNVKRYNVCARTQIADFNADVIPSGECHAVKVLPDGGALVATASTIVRLDASGHIVATYDVAGSPDLWLGVDLVGDGTFWASNYGSSDVVRFDIATGEVVGRFNTGTPTLTVKGVAVARAPSLVAKGRMTGGGSIFTDTRMRVTHGFELHCDAADEPNNLEVNWDGGNRFHLEDLESASCSDDPTIVPTPPDAPFDTYVGRGTGRYNGSPGATAEWTLTDAGEPGRNDQFSLTVRDAAGNVVLTFGRKPLTYGNHQAHK